MHRFNFMKCDMKCTVMIWKVMSLNPCRIELGMHGTSVLSRTSTKNISFMQTLVLTMLHFVRHLVMDYNILHMVTPFTSTSKHFTVNELYIKQLLYKYRVACSQSLTLFASLLNLYITLWKLFWCVHVCNDNYISDKLIRSKCVVNFNDL